MNLRRMDLVLDPVSGEVRREPALWSGRRKGILDGLWPE